MYKKNIRNAPKKYDKFWKIKHIFNIELIFFLFFEIMAEEILGIKTWLAAMRLNVDKTIPICSDKLYAEPVLELSVGEIIK